MEINVNCRETELFHEKVCVYALHFDKETKAFSMSYCAGDMWGIPLMYPPTSTSTDVEFLSGNATVSFERQDEAEAFVAWLIESDAKVRDGFRTMLG